MFVIILIAISLSMDAFSLSLAYGTLNLCKKDVIKLATTVGLYHFLMPLIGLKVGSFLLSFLNFNPALIVFLILSFIGVQMIIESFKKVSNHIGVDSIGWRYDPIFIGNGFDVNKHVECFEKMAKELKGYTHNCTISFLDLYEKVKRNAPDIKTPTKEEQMEIAKAFSKIGKENEMVIHACCEKTYLSQYGLQCNGCMSQEIIEKAINNTLQPPKRKNLRQECNCLMGNDIGAYNTCGHLCKYCYANANKQFVIENMKKHDDNSPFLIGRSEPGDKITEAKQKSWKVENEQISFI